MIRNHEEVPARIETVAGFRRYLYQQPMPWPWWVCAALEKLRCGHYFAITGRNDYDLYLMRLWLSAPQVLASDDGGERFDSGDSILLHWFARGDDDEALHDHPWDFSTEILAGGYTEHLPTGGWLANAWLGKRLIAIDPHTLPGPDWQARTVRRNAGERVVKQATDLHCVGAVDPGTWTLVRTGPRVRDWGFHPPGRPWVPWRQYLDEAKSVARKSDV